MVWCVPGPGWEVWLLPRERTSIPCASPNWTPSQGLNAEAHPVVKPMCPSSLSLNCSGKENLNSLEIGFDYKVQVLLFLSNCPLGC